VVARRPGGTARLRLLGRELIVISRPESVDRVLKNTTGYGKDAPMYAAAAPFLGRSLTVSSGGDDWLLRRRVVHPILARHRRSTVSAATERCVEDLVERWTLRGEDRTNVAQELRRLCLEIACRTLLGSDGPIDVDGLTHDFRTVSDYAPGSLVLSRVPGKRRRAFREAMSRINAFVRNAVASSPALTDVVAEARRVGMSEEDLHEELVGLLFAGHETLAGTLTWCLHLLMAHPPVAAELRGEAQSVLLGRTAGFADVPRLPRARSVVQEAMRLYPVVWMTMRRALRDDVLDGRPVPAGALVVWSPYTVHRDPTTWAEPDRFAPERFDGVGTHRGVPGFRPFGAGQRACPGADFAFAEACVVLSTLLQHFDLSPSTTSIGPRLTMTLHPDPDPTADVRAATGGLVR
jgi:cytochrome P450